MNNMKKLLSQERFEHCIRTKNMAQKLCERYKIDKKAIIAAFYHDIAKEFSLEEMKKLVGNKYKEDIAGMYTKNILHGYAGAEYLKINKIVMDEEILNAVRYHTTGKSGMNDIAKVVYISDAIEIGRCYKNIEKIREEVFKNLNKGILMEIDYKLEMLKLNNIEIHKNTIEFRDFLLKEVENGK